MADAAIIASGQSPGERPRGGGNFRGIGSLGTGKHNDRRLMPATRPLPRPAALRALPQVERVMASATARELAAHHSRPAVLEAVRAELQRRREAGTGAEAASIAQDVLEAVACRLRRDEGAGLRRVINATGIVLHTNLGRAPLAPGALDAMLEIGRGYASLELDLESGGRGSRHGAIARTLRRLVGAEAALVVNNNAAAVLLALSGLAAGGEVIVSRGELVEIGGSFRIPDIIAQSGARLVEVGTTNKTRLVDYEGAITPQARILLKVHPSNYRVVGFTSAVATGELAALGRRRGLAVVEDLGSGSLVDLRRFGLAHEPGVPEALAAGADLVTFSGDKLLGGPQAGLIVGRAALVERLERHPLLRAVRADKLSLAALGATLRLYQDPDQLPDAVPVLAMLAQDGATLAARADRLHAMLDGIAGLEVSVAEGVGYAGGGSLPGAGIPTRLVRVRPVGMASDELARRLRAHRPAVVGRIAEGRLLLDVRTVSEAEVAEVARAVAEAAA
jgi:L-seryl-tRNA(Ser) seleniumtransferase